MMKTKAYIASVAYGAIENQLDFEIPYETRLAIIKQVINIMELMVLEEESQIFAKDGD